MKKLFLELLIRCWVGRQTTVAQVSNLLYRGFPIRRHFGPRTVCRLEVGDTADWKSALLIGRPLRVRHPADTSVSGRGASIAVVLACILALAGCKKSGSPESGHAGKTVIQNTGSDTMVNLAQAWAEEYAMVDSTVSVEVSGGGSGTGIAALIDGTVDIANCSRKVEPQEIEQAKKNSGKEPKEFMLGFDALAVYVHKNNPLEEITLAQLAAIYGEGGKTTKWSELGIKLPGDSSDEIIRVSRQSNSGTYAYFREAILGKGRDFKLGSRDMHGSKDVVELVSKTPGAIGYSGMGYATREVKMVRVAKKTGDQAYAPTVENTLNHTYPISRPLFMYTLGEPNAATKKYLDWLHSAAGQKIVAQSGYVPLPESTAPTATPNRPVNKVGDDVRSL